jgi:hypothetical protein
MWSGETAMDAYASYYNYRRLHGSLLRHYRSFFDRLLSI